MISLEMKCPQLSKPEATAARNQNSIGERTEKTTLGETRLSRGASSPPARRISSLLQLQQSQIVKAQLVPLVFSWKEGFYTKEDILKNVGNRAVLGLIVVYTMEVNGAPKQLGYKLSSKYLLLC